MSEWTNVAAPTPPEHAPRNWKQAMGRGLCSQCPNCGEGRMFRSFLKVNPTCDTCSLALDGHRADDMPPYITIMIVGHVIVGLNLMVEQSSDWPLWWHMALWPSLTLVLALLIMQPVKGALIAYQWALRMHGFDPEGDIHAMTHPIETGSAPRTAPRIAP